MGICTSLYMMMMSVAWGRARSVVHLFSAEPKGIVTPTIVEYTSHVSVAQDEGAVLLCIAQGCPALDYRYLCGHSPCTVDLTFLPTTHPPTYTLLGYHTRI